MSRSQALVSVGQGIRSAAGWWAVRRVDRLHLEPVFGGGSVFWPIVQGLIFKG